jgi:hypothetical protein
MATLFDRLEPAEERVKQPSQTPAQLLLTWLQKWNRPTIRMNQILVYGPSCTRKREDAISATKILTEHRWLTPVETRRSNMLEWQIRRQPLVYPTIET